VATKRGQRRRACSGKVRHPDATAAARTAIALTLTNRRRVFGAFERPVSPYRCSFCGSWHIGHAPRGPWGNP